MNLRAAGLSLSLGLLACASPPRTSTAPAGHAVLSSRASRSPADALRADGALEDLRAHMAAGDRRALALVAVSLASADGAREMTGEVAADERVDRALVVNHEGDAATLLVTTTCGNCALASERWDGTRWAPVTQIALVQDLHPGRCGQTNVRAQALRLASDATREIAVVVVSEDATGESVRGPFLSVFQLGADARLATLLASAPFGAMDDNTGATTLGEFLVVDDVPAPRDLHVSIRPGRPGPGGGPAAEIVRRRYALRAGHLELVEEHREASD